MARKASPIGLLCFSANGIARDFVARMALWCREGHDADVCRRLLHPSSTRLAFRLRPTTFVFSI